MPLTPEQQRTVANHLRSRAQPPQCPVCEAANMVVQAEITLHSTDEEDAPVEPRINVMCKYCGHVLHFSPSAMDISLA